MEKMERIAMDREDIQKEILQDSIKLAETEAADNNESKAIFAANEAMFVSAQADEPFDKNKLAEKLNEKFGTNLTEKDLEKIDEVATKIEDSDFKNATLENVNEAFEKLNKEKNEGKDKQNLIENIAEDAFGELTEGLKNSENILDAATGEMYERWREEYLEEKEKKQEEMEEAFDKNEQNEHEQEDNKNIEEKAQEEGQKEQKNEAEFAEAQAKEAAEIVEFDAGMSM